MTLTVTQVVFGKAGRRIILLAVIMILAAIHVHQWLDLLSSPRGEKSNRQRQGTVDLQRLKLNETVDVQRLELNISKDPIGSYKQRFGRNPPKGFSEWHQFAKDKKCSLAHSTYDRIESDLKRFRNLHADCVRSGKCRPEDPPITAEMLEKASRLERVSKLEVRRGKIIGEGSIADTLNEFGVKLPDGLIAFVNDLDEPRVLRQPPKQIDKVDKRLLAGDNLYKSKFGQPVSSLLKQVCKDLPEERFEQHGFLQAPTSFSVTDQLLPIFSQATISNCFADILFPSGYYLRAGGSFESIPWQNKSSKLYWRGRTTGGSSSSSQNQLFKNFHRHRFVEKFGKNRPGNELDYDIAFIQYLQCDDDACKMQEQIYGPIAKHEDFNKVQEFKYLADIDGNSFSQRVLSFLRYSKSLVFRISFFEDWLSEQLKDGEHVLKVDLSLNDLPDKMRWARENDDEARKIVTKATEFAAEHLRKEDMVCYLYRLLLEYHQLVEHHQQQQHD